MRVPVLRQLVFVPSGVRVDVWCAWIACFPPSNLMPLPLFGWPKCQARYALVKQRADAWSPSNMSSVGRLDNRQEFATALLYVAVGDWFTLLFSPWTAPHWRMTNLTSPNHLVCGWLLIASCAGNAHTWRTSFLFSATMIASLAQFLTYLLL